MSVHYPSPKPSNSVPFPNQPLHVAFADCTCPNSRKTGKTAEPLHSLQSQNSCGSPDRNPT